MSANQKPRGVKAGEKVPELTRLKILWRDSLSGDAREFWRGRFASSDAQSAIRKEIFSKLKINLGSDPALTKFRSWLDQQDAMDEEERRILAEHPDWTKERVREDLLRRFYNRARATGDSKLGLKTIAADVKVESLRFDQEKFKEGLKSKIQAGLDAILAEAGNNPKVFSFNISSPKAYSSIAVRIRIR